MKIISLLKKNGEINQKQREKKIVKEGKKNIRYYLKKKYIKKR